MPRYNFICEKCTIQSYMESQVDGLSVFIRPDAPDFKSEPLIWEETYSIHDSPEVKCPVCAAPCQKTFIGVSMNSFIPGDFLKDTVQCKALSNAHDLQHNDPYAEYRESGEVDDKIKKFRRVAEKRHNWKKERKRRNDKKPEPKAKIDLGKKNTTLL